MKCSERSFAVVLLFAVLLWPSTETRNARAGDFGSYVLGAAQTANVLGAAQTAKKQCLNTCRARYRDCRRLKHLPSSECQGVYQDCARYSCTGLGPG
jgi:hypothetical protein